MEVKTIKVYTLWNEERQCELTMTLGCVTSIKGNAAWRWKLQGKYIPFPVRSNTWFEGFDYAVMLDYMANCGYVCDSVVNMVTGKIHVYNRRPPREPNDYFKVNMAALATQSEENKQRVVIAARHAFDYSVHEAKLKINQWIDELG